MASAKRPPETPHRAEAPVEPASVRLASPFRPTIATRRLVLRPLVASDAAAVAAAIGDPAVSRNLARVPHPYRRTDAEAYVAFTERAAASRRSLILAITRGGVAIGVVSIDAIPARNRLGYWLAQGHWGRGYGSEAVAATIAYALEVLGVRLVRAGVFVDNPASLRIVRKLGFRVIGRRTGRWLARTEPVDFVATVLPSRGFAKPRAAG